MSYQRCPHCQEIYPNGEMCPNSNCEIYKPLIKSMDKLDETINSIGRQINIGKYYTKAEIDAIWDAAIEYIIPFATADYHITAEELRRHKKMTNDNLDDTQQLIQSKGYQDALKEGLEAVRASVGRHRPYLDAPFDSSNTNLGVTKKGYAVASDSVYVKEIWNAAIEAAAKWLETTNRNDTDDAKEIRKLKK